MRGAAHDGVRCKGPGVGQCQGAAEIHPRSRPVSSEIQPRQPRCNPAQVLDDYAKLMTFERVPEEELQQGGEYASIQAEGASSHRGAPMRFCLPGDWKGLESQKRQRSWSCRLLICLAVSRRRAQLVVRRRDAGAAAPAAALPVLGVA